MLKVIIGYIKVNDEGAMEEISGIVNPSPCTIEEEESDFMLVTDLDHETMIELCEHGFISVSELDEIEGLDSIKFYVD